MTEVEIMDWKDGKTKPNDKWRYQIKEMMNSAVAWELNGLKFKIFSKRNDGKRSTKTWLDWDTWINEWRKCNFKDDEWKLDESVLKKYKKDLDVIISHGTKAKRDKYINKWLFHDEDEEIHNQRKKEFIKIVNKVIKKFKTWRKEADGIKVPEVIILNKKKKKKGGRPPKTYVKSEGESNGVHGRSSKSKKSDKVKG